MLHMLALSAVESPLLPRLPWLSHHNVLGRVGSVGVKVGDGGSRLEEGGGPRRDGEVGEEGVRGWQQVGAGVLLLR